MNDPSTLGFALTYAGTLGVAALMFLAQVIAFTGLLVLAGTTSLLAWIGHVIMHRLSR
ncbi:hypothetical protein [Arthrobacter sp. KBS0703]|uniref:hypothetical protein n=1 Tax=Arthrobacter sp. KBS0703 TaxID=1955698 RepID=UPI00163D75CE|nr:hypothetical protein [Arthrobacter sp. KBS0703]